MDSAGVTLAGALDAGVVLQVIDAAGRERARVRVVRAGAGEARAEVARGSVIHVGDRLTPSLEPWRRAGVDGPRSWRGEVLLDVGLAPGATLGGTARLDATVELAPWFYARLTLPLGVDTHSGSGWEAPAVATDVVAAGGFDAGPLSAELQVVWGCGPTWSWAPICEADPVPALGFLVRGGWRDGSRIESTLVATIAPDSELLGLAVAGSVPLGARLDVYGHLQVASTPPTGGWATPVGAGAQLWVVGWGGAGSVAVRAGAGLLEIGQARAAAELGAAVRW